MPVDKKDKRKTTYGGKVRRHKSAKAAKAHSRKMKRKGY